MILPLALSVVAGSGLPAVVTVTVIGVMAASATVALAGARNLVMFVLHHGRIAPMVGQLIADNEGF